MTQLDDISIQIACDSPVKDEGDDNALYLVIKITSDVTHNRYMAGLAALEQAALDPTHCAHRLVEILLGEAPPRFTSASSAVSTKPRPQGSLGEFEDEDDEVILGLNDMQQKAVDVALRAEDLAVIHGPPGTGKTHTLVAYIVHEVARGSRVLVVAPSNVAVDNLAERLVVAASAFTPMHSKSRMKFVRAGHPARMTAGAQPYALDMHVEASDEAQLARDVRDELSQLDRRAATTKDRQERSRIRSEQRTLRKELRQRERTAVARVLNKTDVLLATISGAGGRVFDIAEHGRPFDVVVVDEAAQALEGCVWPALLRARKAVLAGDPFQLAGTVKSPDAAAGGLQSSILDRVFRSQTLASCVTMLTTQYRMHALICNWSSEEFYEGRLEPHESVADRRVTDLEGWVTLSEDDDGISFPFIVIDTAGGDCEEDDDSPDDGAKGANDARRASRRNHGEAGIVKRVVDDLLRHGVQKSDIGVISPYAGQVELMRQEMWNTHGRQLEIATIDSFQGREKEVICISLVRSNEAGDVGFLSDDRRLNVAITRARRGVIVICDSETVCSHPLLERLLQYSELHGVYRSAVVEFEDIVGTFSQLRRPKEAIEAEERASEGRNTGKQNDESTPVMKNSKGNSHRTKKDKSGKVKDENMTDEKREEVKERFRKEIGRFVDNEFIIEKYFSKDLSSLERRIVHEVAEEIGICHASSGFGQDRQVRIWKKKDTDLGINEADQGRLELKELMKEAENLDSDMGNKKPPATSGSQGGRESGENHEGEEVSTSDSGVVAVEGRIEPTETDSKYKETNEMLRELQRARAARASGGGEPQSQLEDCQKVSGEGSAKAGNQTPKRGKKSGAKGKGKGKKGTADKDDEDLSFEATLEKYGWQAGQSSGGRRFSSAVGQIVNGVLVSKVETVDKRNNLVQKKLAEKVSKEAEKRKRKSGR